MIQFNLLPDVKKEYVKAKRTKRLIMSAATLASAGAIGVTVLMFTFVHVAQKKHISDLTKDIESRATEIKSTPDLEKILTVQNQLSLLPGLHQGKPETSRLFNYLSFVSPSAVRFANVDLDNELMTIQILGSADSIATVNKLVNNFKVATFTTGEIQDEAPLFSEVSTTLSGDDTGAEFTINMKFDPVIFNNAQTIIPKIAAGAAEAGER